MDGYRQTEDFDDDDDDDALHLDFLPTTTRIAFN